MIYMFFIIYAAQPSEVSAEEESSCVSMRTSDTDGQQLPALQLSPHIKCFVFPRGDITRFKPARSASFLVVV